MVTLALCVALLIGGILVTLWFFLKPGGIVDGSVNGRDQIIKSLQDSSLLQLKKIAEMEVEIGGIKRDREKLEAMIQSRLSSMESKIGKQSKEDLRQAAFSAIRTANQQ